MEMDKPFKICIINQDGLEEDLPEINKDSLITFDKIQIVVYFPKENHSKVKFEIDINIKRKQPFKVPKNALEGIVDKKIMNCSQLLKEFDIISTGHKKFSRKIFPSTPNNFITLKVLDLKGELLYSYKIYKRKQTGGISEAKKRKAYSEGETKNKKMKLNSFTMENQNQLSMEIEMLILKERINKLEEKIHIENDSDLKFFTSLDTPLFMIENESIPSDFSNLLPKEDEHATDMRKKDSQIQNKKEIKIEPPNLIKNDFTKETFLICLIFLFILYYLIISIKF
jgi:hypothetical protein